MPRPNPRHCLSKARVHRPMGRFSGFKARVWFGILSPFPLLQRRRSNHYRCVCRISVAWLCSRRIPYWRFRWLLSQLSRIRRHIAVIFRFSRQLHTPSPAMQRMPYLQQHTLSISSPLMTPESQHLNI